MKIFVIFGLLTLVLISSSRRLNHYIFRPTLHHLSQAVGEIEKRILKDVLTDKDVTQSIFDGKTNTP